jgi:hypothetical protein
MTDAIKHNTICHIHKIVYMGDFSGPEEMKLLAEKMMHKEMRFHSIMVQSNCQKEFKQSNNSRYCLRP